jgi:hypothetical protein
LGDEPNNLGNAYLCPLESRRKSAKGTHHEVARGFTEKDFHRVGDEPNDLGLPALHWDRAANAAM